MNSGLDWHFYRSSEALVNRVKNILANVVIVSKCLCKWERVLKVNFLCLYSQITVQDVNDNCPVITPMSLTLSPEPVLQLSGIATFTTTDADSGENANIYFKVSEVTEEYVIFKPFPHTTNLQQTTLQK